MMIGHLVATYNELMDCAQDNSGELLARHYASLHAGANVANKNTYLEKIRILSWLNSCAAFLKSLFLEVAHSFFCFLLCYIMVVQFIFIFICCAFIAAASFVCGSHPHPWVGEKMAPQAGFVGVDPAKSSGFWLGVYLPKYSASICDFSSAAGPHSLLGLR